MTALAKANSPSIVDLPPTFIFDVAIGLYPLADLCEQHGFPVEYAEYLGKEPAFLNAVREQERELDETGVSFKVRSGLVADEALQIIRSRIRSTDTPTPVVLDAFKTMAKFAGREPAANAQANAQGAGFSINIVFGDNKPSATVTVDNPPQESLAKHDANPEFEYY